MEDIKELLILGGFIQELYHGLIKLDSNKDSIEYQKILTELKRKIEWEEIVIKRIVDFGKKDEAIKFIEDGKIDNMLMCRYLTKFNINIKENRSTNYNLNIAMGVYIDSLSLALRMLDKYLEEQKDSNVINLKYDIVFISPSVIEKEMVDNNFIARINTTMITDTFKAIYKLPWELHNLVKEQEIENEFIKHLIELINHVLNNSDNASIIYEQVMLRSLIVLSSNENLTLALKGIIDNEKLDIDKEPFKEILKHTREDKLIPIFVSIGPRR